MGHRTGRAVNRLKSDDAPRVSRRIWLFGKWGGGVTRVTCKAGRRPQNRSGELLPLHFYLRAQGASCPIKTGYLQYYLAFLPHF